MLSGDGGAGRGRAAGVRLRPAPARAAAPGDCRADRSLPHLALRAAPWRCSSSTAPPSPPGASTSRPSRRASGCPDAMLSIAMLAVARRCHPGDGPGRPLGGAAGQRAGRDAGRRGVRVLHARHPRHAGLHAAAAAMLLVFGMANAAFDVAMNAAGRHGGGQPHPARDVGPARHVQPWRHGRRGVRGLMLTLGVPPLAHAAMIAAMTALDRRGCCGRAAGGPSGHADHRSPPPCARLARALAAGADGVPRPRRRRGDVRLDGGLYAGCGRCAARLDQLRLRHVLGRHGLWPLWRRPAARAPGRCAHAHRQRLARLCRDRAGHRGSRGRCRR